MKELHIFGDSVLKGVIYDPEANRYRLCKDPLAVDGIAIHNHSVLGATSRRGVELIQKASETDLSGTVSIIEYGGNDCNYQWKAISEAPDSLPDCAVMPGDFTENLKRSADLLQRAGTAVWFSNLLPICEEKFMDFISRGLSYENILHWLGSVRRLYEWQEYYSTLVEKTAKEMGCPVLDLRSAFGNEAKPGFYCADGIHPTEEGHKTIHRYLGGMLPICCEG